MRVSELCEILRNMDGNLPIYAQTWVGASKVYHSFVSVDYRKEPTGYYMGEVTLTKNKLLSFTTVPKGLARFEYTVSDALMAIENASEMDVHITLMKGYSRSVHGIRNVNSNGTACIVELFPV